jgi:hypothetical protein
MPRRRKSHADSDSRKELGQGDRDLADIESAVSPEWLGIAPLPNMPSQYARICPLDTFAEQMVADVQNWYVVTGAGTEHAGTSKLARAGTEHAGIARSIANAINQQCLCWHIDWSSWRDHAQDFFARLCLHRRRRGETVDAAFAELREQVDKVAVLLNKHSDEFDTLKEVLRGVLHREAEQRVASAEVKELAQRLVDTTIQRTESTTVPMADLCGKLQHGLHAVEADIKELQHGVRVVEADINLVLHHGVVAHKDRGQPVMDPNVSAFLNDHRVNRTLADRVMMAQLRAASRSPDPGAVRRTLKEVSSSRVRVRSLPTVDLGRATRAASPGS